MWPVELGSLMVWHSIHSCAPVFELLPIDFSTPPISTEEMVDVGLADPALLGLHWKIKGPLHWKLKGALTYSVSCRVRRWESQMGCKSKEIWYKFQESLSIVKLDYFRGKKMKMRNTEKQWADSIAPKQCMFLHQWVLQVSISICVHGIDLFTKTGAGCDSSR